MKSLILLSMVVFSSCASSNWKEDRVRELEAKRLQREAAIAQYGAEVVNAKNDVYRDHLIKKQQLANNPVKLKEYLDQTRPTKKVLVIKQSADKSTISGEVIDVYDENSN